MQTIEALRAKHAQELAKLEAEIAIYNSLPVKPKRVGIYGKSPWACYEINSIAEFIDIMNSYSVTPMVYARSGCAIVASLEEYPEYANFIELDGIACKIEVTQSNGYTPTVKFCFYTSVEDRLVKVSCELKQDTYKYGAAFDSRTSHDRSIIVAKRANARLSAYANKVVAFSYGNSHEASANYVYCFVGDYDDCSSTSNCVAVLQAIEAAL